MLEPRLDKLFLNQNNKPIKGTGITLLLNQYGKPVLNKKGEPILINKEGKPMNLIGEENKDTHPRVRYPKNSAYPEGEQDYQRITNYRPIGYSKSEPMEYLSSCFACDVGCSVSRSGYSPMTYVPYDNRIKRREQTPLKFENTH